MRDAVCPHCWRRVEATEERICPRCGEEVERWPRWPLFGRAPCPRCGDVMAMRRPTWPVLATCVLIAALVFGERFGGVLLVALAATAVPFARLRGLRFATCVVERCPSCDSLRIGEEEDAADARARRTALWIYGPLAVVFPFSTVSVLATNPRWSGTGVLFCLTVWFVSIYLTFAPRPFWSRWR